jgi:hypothetical protein
MPVSIACQPTGPRFAITADAAMPDIVATARLDGVAINPQGPPPMFEWSATLAFDGGTGATTTPYGAGRRSQHAMMGPSRGPRATWRMPFTQVRGGILTINVVVILGTTTLRASTTGLTLVGTNPTAASIRTFATGIGADRVRFRKQMRQESSLEQFRQPGLWPKYSSDGLGGVGLCQITRPAPTADETWDWKANVRAGWRLYLEKERIARAYPAAVRQGASFRRLVDEFNRGRAASRLPPVPVILPDFTPDQLELDAIRGFNGFANGLHEFRVRTLAGQLVVTLNAAGTQGTAEWERVPVNERGNAGDPNYVNNVEQQADF